MNDLIFDGQGDLSSLKIVATREGLEVDGIFTISWDWIRKAQKRINSVGYVVTTTPLPKADHPHLFLATNGDRTQLFCRETFYYLEGVARSALLEEYPHLFSWEVTMNGLSEEQLSAWRLRSRQ